MGKLKMGGTVQTLPKPMKLGKTENGRNSSDTPGRNSSDTSKTNETRENGKWEEQFRHFQNQ